MPFKQPFLRRQERLFSFVSRTLAFFAVRSVARFFVLGASGLRGP